LNVTTADYCFTSVGVVTGDIAIAVSSVVIKLEERHIGYPNGSIGKRKKAGKLIARRNNEGG
jgi:hypothetical protein